MLLEVGSTYNFNCARKGKFEAKVVDQDSEWVTVEVTDGKTKAMMRYNVAEVGDEVTLRKSFVISAELVGD